MGPRSPALRVAWAALAAFAILIGLSPRAWALQPLEVVAGRPLAGTVPPFEALVDDSGALSFEAVGPGGAAEGRFAGAEPGQHRGYSTAAFWIRFSLRNAGERDGTWLVQLFRTGDVTLYESGGAAVREHRTGATMPFSTREVAHPDVVLRLHVPAGEERTYLARIVSSDTVEITPTVWSEASFFDEAAEQRIVAGVYYGFMLALIAYNLFVFVGVRDRPYGFYVLFMTGYAGMQAAFERLSFQYLWPEHPAFAMRSEFLFAAMMVGGSARFALEFLEVRRVAPGMARVLQAIAIGAVALAGVGLVTTHTIAQQVGLAFVLGSCTFFAATGVVAWIRKSPSAPFYVAAWAALFGGTVADALTTFGVLGSQPIPTAWLRVGSAGEALLLAFGLANRMNLMRREKDRARRELDESRAAYALTLERRVEERTQELSRTMENLAAAEKELAQRARLAALGRLVAGVAHEINNPLNFAVGGTGELRRSLEAAGSALRTGESAGAEPAAKALVGADRALRLVQSGTERIGRIVKNLQIYSQLGRVAPEPTDIAAEIERALALAAARLEASSVRVVTSLEPLPPLSCAAGELGQVFVNLIVNACQAMPEGGELRIAAKATEADVVIELHDTGPGVAHEHEDAIFEPFFTTRAPGDGTGLGLSISHEIVRRHGGELTLVPTDAGACFRIVLPIAGPPRGARTS